MFEPKNLSKEKLVAYIGARVTEAEETRLQAERTRLNMSMSDLIRLALKQYVKNENTGRRRNDY